jgi:heme-degrading monooxygenase HmoA
MDVMTWRIGSGNMTTTADMTDVKFARVWRGRTRRDKADEYERYWLANGIAPLEARGALGVQMLRDDRGAETEFVTISWWSSVEAMTGRSGGDPHLTHHLDRDPEFLIEVPKEVQILTILATRVASTR